MIKIMARGQSEAEILIHEAIGENWFGDGMTSKKFIEQLGELGNVTKITVRINSPGGAVHDGIAIYNALRNHGARIEVLVEGLAASIASIIAMSGDTIRMGTGAMMMIHAPWTFAMGNAEEMREVADVLEKHEQALIDIYVKRSGQERDEVKELIAAETWMTGPEAMDLGFCDECDSEYQETEDSKAKHRTAFTDFANEFRQHMAALTPLQVAAALKSAVADANQETNVNRPAASVPGAQPPANQPAAQPPAAAAPTPATDQQLATARAEGAAAEVARRAAIRGRFPGPLAAAHATLLQTCMDDPNCTADAAAVQLLELLGKATTPLAPAPSDPPVVPGQDESDKRIEAATLAIMARIGAKVKDKDGVRDVLPVVDASNPFRGFSLYDIAEDAVRRVNVNVRGMNRSQVVAIAFRGRIQAAQYGHTTSDFPKLLENVMHKLLLVAYTGAATTWERICRIGDLSDFRAHPRYRFGTFSDIKEVNEAGRYEQGTISDAEKESITAKRKGRLLVITREMIVNDDLQALSDAARGMGRAANRTIDKDVYALLLLNAGLGPTMSDGQTMFHATHGNIAGTAGAPTVVLVDQARVLLSKQTDPSGNDFLDLVPAVALSGKELGSTLRVLNDSQYDPDANNKLQRPNTVRGLFRDVVDTPRLTAVPWYIFADPNEEPVLEVGFIGGAREPRVEQEQEFSSDSLIWKVVHEYGTAGIGWRGAVRNAGA